MGYYIRFFDTSEKPVTLHEIGDALRLVDPTYRLEASEQARRPEADLYLGDALLAELEINSPGDGLFEDEIAEMLEFLEDAEGEGRRRVEEVLTSARWIVSARVLGGDLEWEETCNGIQPLWNWLLSSRPGLLQADGEGYYDADGFVLNLATLDQTPFVRLASPRKVEHSELPSPLVQFYAEYEGVGLQSSPDRLVRLCRLDEVERIGWRDVHIFGADQCPGWEQFEAYRIGVSSFFDEIVYVLNAPCCPAGSILTIGVDISGPGGSGPAVIEPSLVLASGFSEWLNHLKECNWVEYGLVPGQLAEMPEGEQQELRRYYQALNPGIEW